MDRVLTSPPPSGRIASIDLIRGAVMVLMAIDHVRVYAGVPAGGPEPAVFFTRWITHFCAPCFVFFAGTAIFLHGRKLGNPGQLSRFLLARGAFLVVLELTLLRAAWTFNFDYAHYVLAGVIWMIGWCMILMAGLVRLPAPLVGGLGLATICGHNLIDPHLPQILPALAHDRFAWLWQLLYFGGPIELGRSGSQLAVLYSIVPWIGVMAAGYGFGRMSVRADLSGPALAENGRNPAAAGNDAGPGAAEEARRRWASRQARLCHAIGGSAIAAFLLLRGWNLYGDPRPWSAHSARLSPLLSFLNTTKYPASLLFLLMTLGPPIAAIPLLERARGAVARALIVFGRVPLFFYLLHIPLIHLTALLVSLARRGVIDPWLFANHPMMPPEPPAGYVWSLPLLYLVWAAVVTVLYFACRWFATVKRTHTAAWLSYL